MARAVTENYAEMVVEIETSGGELPPAAVSATSVSNATPAVVTVGTAAIADFLDGDTVTISGGVGTGMTAINGSHPISAVNTGAGTFTLTGVDTSAAAAPQTSGVLVQPMGSGDVLVWAKICGLTSRTVSRTNTMTQTEVPDCDDESLPSSIEKSVQSAEVTISGTGVWAAQNHGIMMDWWRSGSTKAIRVGNLKALSGDPLYEEGPAFLTSLNNTAERGQKVTSEIAIEFDGMPSLVLQA